MNFGSALTSLLVLSVGTAIIFRVAPLREIVTGIRTADAKGVPPPGGSALYM